MLGTVSCGSSFSVDPETPLGSFELQTISGIQLYRATQLVDGRQETFRAETLALGFPLGSYTVRSTVSVTDDTSTRIVRRVVSGRLEPDSPGRWQMPDFHGGPATFTWTRSLGLTVRGGDGREWGYWACYC